MIRGKHNIRELRLARPTATPTATLRRIIGSGDLWAAEMIFDYNGDRFYTVLITNTAMGSSHAKPVTAELPSRRPPGGRSGSS